MRIFLKGNILFPSMSLALVQTVRDIYIECSNSSFIRERGGEEINFCSETFLREFICYKSCSIHCHQVNYPLQIILG